MKSTLAQDFAINAYRQYGQHVVGNRAVADYRDGLKPVQRRILWSMHKLGLKPGAKYKTSALTVGDVLGKFHPSGDSSVYDALVGMVNSHYPLIDGEGNFGTLTDRAAAYRYTLCRLHTTSDRMIGSDDSTIQTQPTFNDQDVEPVCFAAELPFLLLNGCSGIAVGIASEIPEHNLTEVVGACCEILETDDAVTLEQLLQHIHGPDYGAGVLLSTSDAVRAMYRAGEGQLSFRCQYRFESNQLIITSYAPRFNIQKFVQICGTFIEAGNLLYCTDKSSKKDGYKLVVGFQSARFVHDHVLPLLETSISYRFFVNESKPEGAVTMQLGLVDLLTRWVAFRIKNEKRLIRSDIQRINRKLEITGARRIGAQNIQQIAKLLTRDVADLEQALVDALLCTREVAGIILDTQLRQLARLEVAQLEREIAALEKERTAAEESLKNVRSIVAAKLRSAIPANDPRGTLLNQKRPKLELPAEDEVDAWVACSRDGKVIRLEGKPDERRGSMKAWDQLIQTGNFLWVVNSSGSMQRIDVASLTVGKPKSMGELAGIASSAAQRIVVMDQNGEGLILDAGTLVKDKYQSMKTTNKMVRAFGMRHTDGLAAWNKKALHVHVAAKLQTTRMNSGGWKLLPKYKKGADEVVAVRGKVAYCCEGTLRNSPNPPPTDIDTPVCGRCYVEWDDGEKTIATMKVLLDVQGKRKIQKILSLG